MRHWVFVIFLVSTASESRCKSKQSFFEKHQEKLEKFVTFKITIILLRWRCGARTQALLPQLVAADWAQQSGLVRARLLLSARLDY